MDRCGGCGFLYDEAAAAVAPDRILEAVDDLAPLLSGPGLARRPAPDTWSRLEYGCHLRDVLLVQRERVLLARRVECPELVPMGRDERVEHDGYRDQDPVDVRRQLRDAASLLAGCLRRLDAGGWHRTVVYNWPVRAERTLAWLAINALHEVLHHGDDIRSQTGATAP